MSQMGKGRALLFWILALGLLLRVYAAVSHLDISHPDEHFQTLEPASHVVYGYGWLSWEWFKGTRSWLVPALYMPILWIFKMLGYNGGAAPITACRVMMALLSTFMLYEFWVLLKESGIKRGASLLTLAFFALSPACAAWGAMTLSDLWAMVLVWCALPKVLRAIEQEKDLVLAGALLGLSFLVRIQTVLWPIGIVAVLMFRRPFPWRTICLAALGYLGVVCIQGVLDWATWGVPFHSVYSNIYENIFNKVADFYGTSPFYEYFLSIPKQLGALTVGLIVVCAAYALFFRRARMSFRDALILVPALLYTLVHCMISHKETRFMFPMIPALFYLLAWGFNQIEVKWRIREDLFAGVLLLTAAGACGFVYSDEHTYSFDLSELTRKIREDGALAQGGCVLLLDHYWVWTRGDLMIGSPAEYFEISSQNTPSDKLTEAQQKCPYAISLGGRQLWFNHPGGPQWQELARDNHGQYLMKRVLTKS